MLVLHARLMPDDWGKAGRCAEGNDEARSILVTSNSSVADRVGVFSDAVVATAIPDRLLHHSYVITIRGDCYRLRTNPASKSGP